MQTLLGIASQMYCRRLDWPQVLRSLVAAAAAAAALLELLVAAEAAQSVEWVAGVVDRHSQLGEP